MHFTISLTALKHKKTCIKAVEVDPSYLQLVPDHFKMQEICDKAVKDDSSSLQFVPDWFIIREWTDMWHDDYYGDDGCHWGDDDGDKLFEWHDGYKKREAQKTSIKKELLPIAWHPSKWWDWCMSEDEKKRQKNCGHKHGPFLSLVTTYKSFLTQND